MTIDTSNRSILSILENTYDNIHFEIHNIIHKDSLDMDGRDRKQLVQTIEECTNPVIVVHGTDTMKQSCRYVDEALTPLDRVVIFTGSMYPYYVKNSESTFNLATAIGAVKFLQKNGVYIAMHGIVDHYKDVEKDYERGRFYRL